MSMAPGGFLAVCRLRGWGAGAWTRQELTPPPGGGRGGAACLHSPASSVGVRAESMAPAVAPDTGPLIPRGATSG